MATIPAGDSALEAERNRARDRLAATRSRLTAATREAFPPGPPPESLEPGYPRSHLFRAVRRHRKTLLLVGAGLFALAQPRRAVALATRGMALVATIRGLSSQIGPR